MTKEQAIVWLRDVALYFDRKAEESKDTWFSAAMRNNAESARNIANLIQFDRK